MDISDLVPVDPSDRIQDRKDHPEKYLSMRDLPPPKPSSIPSWLSPDNHDLSIRDPHAPVSLKEFANMFPWVCDRIASGEALNVILNRDPRSPDTGRFIRWIMSDEDRKNAYYDAQAKWAEVMLSEDILRIADGDDSIVDVARSKLMLDTRWRIMAICNRKRFGDIKQMDQNVTINLVDAMRDADKRVRTINVGNGDYESE